MLPVIGKSCVECRASRIKCDGNPSKEVGKAQQECSRCLRKGITCVYIEKQKPGPKSKLKRTFREESYDETSIVDDAEQNSPVVVENSSSSLVPVTESTESSTYRQVAIATLSTSDVPDPTIDGVPNYQSILRSLMDDVRVPEQRVLPYLMTESRIPDQTWCFQIMKFRDRLLPPLCILQKSIILENCTCVGPIIISGSSDDAFPYPFTVLLINSTILGSIHFINYSCTNTVFCLGGRTIITGQVINGVLLNML